jgi:hypothetical protein
LIVLATAAVVIGDTPPFSNNNVKNSNYINVVGNNAYVIINADNNNINYEHIIVDYDPT